jgi:hypothetical protein
MSPHPSLRIGSLVQTELHKRSSEALLSALPSWTQSNSTSATFFVRAITPISVRNKGGGGSSKPIHSEPWYIAMDSLPNEYKTRDYSLKWEIKNIFFDPNLQLYFEWAEDAYFETGFCSHLYFKNYPETADLTKEHPFLNYTFFITQ